MTTPDPAGETPPAAPRTAPAAVRNAEPIREVLSQLLPPTGSVLELASGTGQHVAGFARAFPGIAWQPSDIDPEALASTRAWCAGSDCSNLSDPIPLDATSDTWPPGPFAAVIAINMIHIAPWEACLGLFRGAAEVLSPPGQLILYGPFARDGSHTAPSNAEFDAMLRSRDPRWGVRDLADVCRVAEDVGLRLAAEFSMPANNFTVVFER